MCVDGLLQLFLFGPSAVAKLWNNTKTVNTPFFFKCKILHFYIQIKTAHHGCLYTDTTLPASHHSLLHEAGQKFVDVRASLQEVFSRFF